MKQITLSRMEELADKDVWPVILKRAEDFKSTHIVCFVNNNMSSSHLGEMTFVVIGPHNTFKKPDDCVDAHLNDLPSQRQYAEWYCEIK